MSSPRENAPRDLEAAIRDLLSVQEATRREFVEGRSPATLSFSKAIEGVLAFLKAIEPKEQFPVLETAVLCLADRSRGLDEPLMAPAPNRANKKRKGFVAHAFWIEVSALVSHLCLKPKNRKLARLRQDQACFVVACAMQKIGFTAPDGSPIDWETIQSRHNEALRRGSRIKSSEDDPLTHDDFDEYIKLITKDAVKARARVLITELQETDSRVLALRFMARIRARYRPIVL